MQDDKGKPVYNPKIDKQNNLKIVIMLIVYIAVLFLLGALIMYPIGMMVSNLKNLDFNELQELFTKSDLSIYTDELKDGYYVTLGYDNFFAYLITLAILLVLALPLFKEDFINFKQNKKFYLICLAIFPIAFCILAYLIDLIMSFIVKDSSNQESIINILNSDALAVTIITTVILAPIVEELIFRKALHKLLSRFHIAIFYVLSSFAFAIIHMLSGNADFLTLFLQFIPYFLSGLMLAFIYHKSKYNIYITIICHMLNNILAIILVLV